MHPRQPRESDAEVLADPLALRLLTRASELDAARSAGAQIAELRSAAEQAGISADAFDAALAELRAAEHAPVPDARALPPRRRWTRLLVGVAALAVGALFSLRLFVSVGAPPIAGMVEEAFLLRCLQPGEAAELVRPLLGLPENSIVYSATGAPRVLTVHATPAQIQDVRALLERYEGAGSPTCTPAGRPR